MQVGCLTPSIYINLHMDLKLTRIRFNFSALNSTMVDRKCCAFTLKKTQHL